MSDHNLNTAVRGPASPRLPGGLRDDRFISNGSILPGIARPRGDRLVSVVAILAGRDHPEVFDRISAIPLALIDFVMSFFLNDQGTERGCPFGSAARRHSR